MSDITLTEWDAKLLQLAEQLRMFASPCDVAIWYHGLHVTARDVLSVFLEPEFDGEGAFLRAKIGSSASLPGDITSARGALTMAALVISTIEMAYALTAGTRVWLDGYCPCGTCGARGYEFSPSVPCPRCDGKGKR